MRKPLSLLDFYNHYSEENMFYFLYTPYKYVPYKNEKKDLIYTFSNINMLKTICSEMLCFPNMISLLKILSNIYISSDKKDYVIRTHIDNINGYSILYRIRKTPISDTLKIWLENLSEEGKLDEIKEICKITNKDIVVNKLKDTYILELFELLNKHNPTKFTRNRFFNMK
jgi:hypothetical protein